MAQENAKKRERIRAAQAWLEQADDSLAQDRSVQGDLKLMLAKAELAQTSDSSRIRRWKARGSKAAALCAAVIIAWGGHSFLTEGSPEQREHSQPPQPVQLAGADVSQQPEEQDAAKDLSVPALELEAWEETARVADIYGTVEPGSPIGAASPHMTYHQDPEQDEPEKDTAEDAQLSTAVPVSTPDFQSEPMIPDVQTQLLMQQAGQVLRR